MRMTSGNRAAFWRGSLADGAAGFRTGRGVPDRRPSGLRSGGGLRCAACRPQGASAAHMADGSAVRDGSAAGLPVVHARSRRRKVPVLYRCGHGTGRVGVVFDGKSAGIANFCENFSDSMWAADKNFEIFTANCKKTLFILEKMGYYKMYTWAQHAQETLLQRRERPCASKNRRS